MRTTTAMFIALGAVLSSCTPEYDQRQTYAAAIGAHAICGGYFVVGRDYQRPLAEVIERDVAPFAAFEWNSDFEVALDEEAGTVTVTGDAIPDRVAMYGGDQGCTILPLGATDTSFEPHHVTSTLPDPSTQAWPTGDVGAYRELNSSVKAAMDVVLDAAMAREDQNTRALMVVHDGQIVGERYAEGFRKTTPQISWSQGKSLTATLAAVLMQQGHFTWTDQAPIAEWHGADDPRRDITIANLLNMSSGLDLQNYGLGNDSALTVENEHMFVYFEALNVFEHVVSQPLGIPVNSQNRYRNSDPLSIGRIIRQTVEGRGDVYHQFAQTNLFDRIGVRSAVLETDPYGNYIMSGYEYLSVVDWTRIGMLYLQNGFWEGERILPDGWVDFVRTPAAADPTLNYGGMFWLNRGGALPDVPADAYWAAGLMGQLTFIIPSEDLVVARLGPSPVGANQYMNDVLRGVIEALKQ